MRILALALLVTGCDGTRIESNGEDGELLAGIKTPVGVAVLGPLHAGEATILEIYREETTTGSGGRQTEVVSWTGGPPVVSFEPLALGAVSNLEFSGVLTFTLTLASAGSGTLRVESEAYTDHWAISAN